MHRTTSASLRLRFPMADPLADAISWWTDLLTPKRGEAPKIMTYTSSPVSLRTVIEKNLDDTESNAETFSETTGSETTGATAREDNEEPQTEEATAEEAPTRADADIPTHSFVIEKTTPEAAIGVMLESTSDEQHLIIIKTMVKDGLAAKAGLLVGDRVIAVDDMTVTDVDEATEIMKAAPGAVTIRIEQRPKFTVHNPGTNGRLGMSIADGNESTGWAPWLMQCAPDCPIADAGLRASDRIASVDGVAVTDCGDVIAKLKAAFETAATAEVAIVRRGRHGSGHDISKEMRKMMRLKSKKNSKR